MHASTAVFKAYSMGCKSLGLAILCLYSSAAAEPLEQTIADTFSDTYQHNEQRLVAIGEELANLPVPYPRESTGSGGFISTQKKHSDDEVVLTFNWEQSHSIDAAALFPLRLFMDEIYAENLYWPQQISIETELNGTTITLTKIESSVSELAQSLPEFVRFDAVNTDNIIIRCTGLKQHPDRQWYAAGFAEVFIFSDKKNVAPLAKLETNGSRNGIYVLWAKFLTDDQTPLGIPQTRTQAEKNPTFFRVALGKKQLSKHPLTLTLHYTEPVKIDAIRLDPASRSFHGQGFPERFSIELLDAEGTVQQHYTQNAHAPLRNPALNPYFARFHATTASAVRINILKEPEAYKPVGPFIELSEITPMNRGLASGVVDRIVMQFGDSTVDLINGRPGRSNSQKGLATLIDGISEGGRIISQHEWAEGLHQRQQLMEEQLRLQQSQQSILAQIHGALLMGSILLIVITIGGATFIVVRNRMRTRSEIQITRAQIASDLHDDVGSNLGTIIIRAEQLQKLDYLPTDRGRLQQILQLTKESVLGLQEVLQTTSPEIGHHKSLATHLLELTELMLGQTAYTIDIDPIANDALSENLTRGRFMLFYKEAIHNAKKHANCSQVEISLKSGARSLILNIADDGIGIEADKLSKARTLRTLKKRAEWLGGKLTINSAPQQGTRLTLELPLDALKKIRNDL